MAQAELYKVALLLTRNPAIAAGDFSDRWLAATPATVGAGPCQRVHNAAALAEVPIENAPPAPFDAVEELLFEDAAQAEAWMGSDAFRATWLDRAAALLGAPVQLISGRAVQVWERPGSPSDDAIKILTLPVRRQGMTMADFADHWIVTHAGLALSEPSARDRLLRLVSTPADKRDIVGIPHAPFDGIGIIQFDSLASLEAEFASDHYRDVMAPDEPRFTDSTASRAMMVKERIVPTAI